MTPELAQYLLDGIKALAKDPNLVMWHGVPRAELLWFVVELTGKEEISQAIIILEKIAKESASHNIPPNLKELVSEFEKLQKERALDSTQVIAARIRVLIENAKRQPQALEQEIVAKTAPSARPVIQSPPAAPAPAKGPQKPTQSIYLAKTTPSIPITNTFSHLPVSIARLAFSLGSQTLAKNNPSVRTLSLLWSQGITSEKMKEAFVALQKKEVVAPEIIQGIKKQIEILTAYEASHTVLTNMLKSFFQTAQTQIELFISSTPSPPSKKERGKVFEIVLDTTSGWIANIKPLITHGIIFRTLRFFANPPLRLLAAPLRRVAAQSISWLGITSVKAGGEIAEQIFGKTRAAAPPTTLPSFGLPQVAPVVRTQAPRFLTFAIGTPLRWGLSAGFRSLEGLTSVGRTVALPSPGTGVALKPISFGIGGGLLAIIISGVLVIPLVLTLIISGHQKAYLGVGGEGVAGSIFIDVTKTVAPRNTFQNSELPQKVTYTITIAPTKDPLVDVKIKDVATISQESGSRTLEERSWTEAEITTSITKTHEISLLNGMEDSLIVNIVTVTASVGDALAPETQTTTNTVTIGNPPQDCPSGWPTARGSVRQGPNGSFSHSGVEAIDIDQPRGTAVNATHRGVVSVVIEQERPDYCLAEKSKWNAPGRAVKITGLCDGKTFISRYAHLQSISVNPGQQVTKGVQVGTLGESGCANYPHLHYQFNGLEMKPPFIDKLVPRGCLGTCNVKWPD